MEQERRTLSEFVEGRVRSFKGRVETIDKLLQFAIPANNENNLLGYCLTGTAGSGKSAVFAKLYSELEKKDLWLLANAAGPGAKSTDVDSILERWIGELCANLGLKNPIAKQEEKAERELLGDDKNKPNRSEELENTFRRLLYQASEQKRVVVLMDALDQMEQTNRSRYLNWLPSIWPEKARLISTAIPGTQTDSFAKRERMELFELPLLEQKTAEEIVTEICNKYHRELNPEVLDIILKKERDGVQALSNPLWLSMAIEELNLIDSDDFAYADKQYEGDSESKLFQLLLDKANKMPAGVEELYQWIFERLEKIFGNPFVKACLSFIAIGRKGWGERELEALVPELTKEKWVALNWAAMRRLLRAHLVQSDTGLWKFFHGQMARSVCKYYLADEKEKEALHLQLSNYLQNLSRDNSLRYEIMHHLLGGKNVAMAASYYSQKLYEKENNEATETIGAYIITSADEQITQQRLIYVLSLLDVTAIEKNYKITLTSKYLFEIGTFIENKISLVTEYEYWSELNKKLTVLTIESSEFLYNLVATYVKLGDLKKVLGDLESALDLYEHALNVAAVIADEDNNDVDWQRNYALLYTKIGDVEKQKENLKSAFDSYGNALRLRQKLQKAFPDNTILLRDLSLSYTYVAEILKAQGNLQASQKFYEIAQDMFQHILKDHPNEKMYHIDLSITFRKIGELKLNEGNLPEATKLFESSLNLVKQFAENDPGDMNNQYALSCAYSSFADIKSLQGDDKISLNLYNSAVEIMERIIKVDPNNLVWKSDVCSMYNRIGGIYLRHGQPDMALESYLSGMSIIKKLLEIDQSNTRWRHQLSISYDRIGDVYREKKNYDAALNSYKSCLQIRKELEKVDSLNFIWQHDLAVAYNKIGVIQQAIGKLNLAEDAYDFSIKLLSRLADSDASNSIWKDELAVSYNLRGDLEKTRDNLGPAINFYESSLKLREKLVSFDSTNADWQYSLGLTYSNIGLIHMRSMDYTSAVNYFRLAIATLNLIVQKYPDNSVWNDSLNLSYFFLGDVQKEIGDATSARQSYQSSAEILEKSGMASFNFLPNRTRLAKLYYKLGLIDFENNQMGEALKSFQRFISVAEDLKDRYPEFHELDQMLLPASKFVGKVY
jgi:tetratricopeptide (TPR) repeat protein